MKFKFQMELDEKYQLIALKVVIFCWYAGLYNLINLYIFQWFRNDDFHLFSVCMFNAISNNSYEDGKK